MMELTDKQKILLETLKESNLSNKFYWTGGTLLAIYYLHHRYSYDLDLFSEQPFSYEELIPFINLVKKKLSISKIKEHKIHDRWEFIISDEEITRIEFVYYNHEKKRLRPLQNFMGISIDSLEDIAANKTMAYFDRNEPKDLFDLYFLMTKKRFSALTLLSLVKNKFGASFSEFMFWSESTKSLNLLSSLRPLIPDKDPEEQERIILSIRDFFLDKGKKYLAKELE